jgi:hypothetical protein
MWVGGWLLHLCPTLITCQVSLQLFPHFFASSSSRFIQLVWDKPAGLSFYSYLQGLSEQKLVFFIVQSEGANAI